jgi:hypothetical protein
MHENKDRNVWQSFEAMGVTAAMTANTLRYVALHAAGGAVFGFALQYFALGARLEISLLWAAAFGLAAAGLAWHQSKR